VSDVSKRDENSGLDAFAAFNTSGRQESGRSGFARNWKPWNMSCDWFAVRGLV